MARVGIGGGALAVGLEQHPRRHRNRARRMQVDEHAAVVAGDDGVGGHAHVRLRRHHRALRIDQTETQRLLRLRRERRARTIAHQ
jgi:hypothetical protein